MAPKAQSKKKTTNWAHQNLKLLHFKSHYGVVHMHNGILLSHKVYESHHLQRHCSVKKAKHKNTSTP
jgi:hypothetical protein